MKRFALIGFLFVFSTRGGVVYAFNPALAEGPTVTPTPIGPDFDLDGIADSLEMGPFVNPGFTNMYLPDSDWDGLWDGVEDANRNGIHNEPGETNPRNRDSDWDGFEDGIEVFFLSSDPLNAASPGTVFVDADGDFLPDSLDPNDNDADSDGDRYLDGFEATWFQELDAASNAEMVPQLGNVFELLQHPPNTVDNADSQWVLNFFANRPLHPAFVSTRSDLNLDAWIDGADAQHTLNFFSRLHPYLPFRVIHAQ